MNTSDNSDDTRVNSGDTKPTPEQLKMVARSNQRKDIEAGLEADELRVEVERLQKILHRVNTGNNPWKVALTISLIINAISLVFFGIKATDDPSSSQPKTSVSNPEKPGKLSNGETSVLSPVYDRKVVENIEALATLLREPRSSVLDRDKLPDLYLEKAKLESLRYDHEAAIKTLAEALESLKHELFSNDECSIRLYKAEQHRRFLENYPPKDSKTIASHADAGISDLSLCMNSSPENVSIYIELGKLYRMKKQLDKARTYFNVATELLNKPSQRDNPDRRRFESELSYEQDLLEQMLGSEK